MFNLLKKDFILQKNTMIFLLPIFILFLTQNSSSIWNALIFSIALAMNAFAIDEKPEINKMLNALPYTRKEIVSSKYFGTLIYTALVVLVVFVWNISIHATLTSWKEALLIFGLVMLAISFLFPFSYQFKSQYLLIGTLGLFGVTMVVARIFDLNMAGTLMSTFEYMVSLNGNEILLLAVLVSFVYLISWAVSLTIYSRKVF
ncbi:ABC-2 transporter permease [Cytobacillus kochii]|uniref:ABC-2 transporter permease n=1 Tax=Cytobacillus kochii TaxID=859143 RepID=UPI0025A10E2D|nr:ABC-2 transporter permease [Cytobacillus kochii]MDM5206330.1 ABC-2 transporter permease [Cytobacillus kochii]